MVRMSTVRRVIATGICCAFLFLMLVVPYVASAQFMKPTTEIDLALDNQFPEPNTTVTVSISAFGYNTDNATVSWYVDGKVVSASANQKFIDVPMGASGQSVAVEARLSSVSLGTYTLKRSIVPSAVDIIAEPITYVPKNYIGKALPTPGNPVRVIAVPQLYKGGKPIPKKDILFTWVVNGQTLFGGAQLGTDVTTISQPRYGNADITVIAEAKDGTRSARNSVTLTPVKSPLLFYEVHSLYGTLLLSPKHFISEKDEIAIRAEPYYLSYDSVGNTSLDYTWTVDGRSNAVGGDPRTIALTKAGGDSIRNVAVTYMSNNGELNLGRGTFDITFTEDAILPSI